MAQAVLRMGLTTLRQLALSFGLMDKLFEPEQRVQQHEELAGAMLACSLAGKLMDELDTDDSDVGSPKRDVAEVATLAKGLGRLVTAAYAFGEYRDICAREKQGQTPSEASMAVLGATFDDLASGVSERLDLPAGHTSATDGPFFGQLASLTTTLSRALVSSGLRLSDKTVAESLEVVVENFGLPRSTVVALTETAMREFECVKAALKARADKDVAAERAAVKEQPKAAALSETEVAFKKAVSKANLVLSQACQKMTDSRTIAQRSVELLTLVGGFRNVLYCERTGRESFQARAGTGAGMGLKNRQWIIEVGQKSSLIDLALNKGVSVTLVDIEGQNMRGRLPDWVRQAFGTPGSLVFIPLGTGAAASGLFYCDKAGRGSEISEAFQDAVKQVKEGMLAAHRRERRIL